MSYMRTVPAREAGSAVLHLLDQGSAKCPEAAQAHLLRPCLPQDSQIQDWAARSPAAVKSDQRGIISAWMFGA